MRRTRTLLASVVIIVTLDTALSLLFWARETNPVVLELGPTLWAAVKMVAVVGLIMVWALTDPPRTRVERGAYVGMHVLLAVILAVYLVLGPVASVIDLLLF